MSDLCDCRTPCGAVCLCLCHNPELIPREPRPEQTPFGYKRRPFFGLFIMGFILINITDPFRHFLAGNYGTSSILFLILAFMWLSGRQHMKEGLQWLGGRR